MSAEEFSRYDSMKLFLHQIYEFQKGVRSLVLCTMCRTCASLLSERLERLGIAYRIQSVTDSKVNLYFGNRMCLETVATFIHKPLNELSAEEDFMLGAMLGYDIAGQCERYCMYFFLGQLHTGYRQSDRYISLSDFRFYQRNRHICPPYQ